MQRISRITGVLAVCLAATVSLTAIGAAQSANTQDAQSQNNAQGSQRSGRQKKEIRVYQISESDANDVAAVIKRVVSGAQCSVDERTNALIVSAPEEYMAKIGEIIAELEKLPPSRLYERQESESKTYYVESPVTLRDSLRATLMSVVSPGTRIASEGRLVVVRGTKGDAAAVEEYLTLVAKTQQKVTKAPRAIQLSFYFIETSLDKASEAAAFRPLPDALKAIGDALGEAGYRHPWLLAPLTVTVNSDDYEFRVQGLANRPNASTQYALSIRGQVMLSPDERSAQLNVEAELKGAVSPRRTRGDASGAPRPGMPARFEINTHISVDLGDYVVLAASPSSSGASEAIALVVRMTLVK